MRRFQTKICTTLAMVIVPLAHVSAADDVKPAANNAQPGSQQMELYNGAVRTVAYFGSGFSQSDQVQRLRREYVGDEITTERYRQAVQDGMYSYAAGLTPLYTSYVPATVYADYVTPSRYYYYGAPYYASFPYTAGSAGAPLVTTGFQGGWQGVASGANHEGPIKTDTALTLASAGAVNSSIRAYDAMAALVDASPSLANLTALRSSAVSPTVVPAAYTEAGVGKRVQLVLRNDKEKIEGKMMAREGDWYVVDTAGGRQYIRDSHVVRMVEFKSSVRPAGGPEKRK
jgi:hypothetical protein